jgi:hypothetical protein
MKEKSTKATGKKTNDKKLSTKEARKLVNEKLTTALAEYQGIMSEKQFRVKLKKAAKLFATDIAKGFNRKNRERVKKETVIPG